MNKKLRKSKLIAAKLADWDQVVGNGGPPCFHLSDDGRFCLRAQRWDGHHDIGGPPIHEYVSLYDLLNGF